MTTLFTYLKGCHIEEALLSVVPEGRTRTSELKRQERGFRLGMRMNFLTIRLVHYQKSALCSFGLFLVESFQAEME